VNDANARSLISLRSTVHVRCVPRRYDPKTDKLVAIPTNHNLINLTLMITGPQHEKVLVRKLLLLQVLCSALAFFIRYQVAAYFYATPVLKSV
jgi:hypothetical protein